MTSQRSNISQCSICMEGYADDGQHTICSLRCGHLFGESCIRKWIKEHTNILFGIHNAICPLCNKAAELKDIRTLWITGDLQEAGTSLMNQESGTNSTNDETHYDFFRRSGKFKKYFSRYCGDLVRPIYAICPVNQQLLYSSFNSNVGMYGLFTIRIETARAEPNFIAIHNRPICSMKVKPASDLVLTASEREVKLTSLHHSDVIRKYSCSEVRHVSWSIQNDTQFYAVTENSLCYLYDSRKPSHCIFEYKLDMGLTRDIAAASFENSNGLLTIDDGNLHYLDASEELPHSETISMKPDSDTGVYFSVDFNRKHQLALVTTKRDDLMGRVYLARLNRNSDGFRDATVLKSLDVPISSLCKLRLLDHPVLEDNVLIGALTKNTTRGSVTVELQDPLVDDFYQEISVDKEIIDMALDGSNLYLFGERNLHIYKWEEEPKK